MIGSQKDSIPSLTAPELKAALLATGDKRLINGQKNASKWGVSLYTWEGENLLGYALMETRDCLRSKTREV